VPAAEAAPAPSPRPALDRIVLWDIDGTLVHTAGVGAEAFVTAIETLFGVPAAGHGVSLAGKTDLQIGQEILTALALADTVGPLDAGDPAAGDPAAADPAAAEAGARLRRLIAETERLVAAGQDRIRSNGRILPGVSDLLAALAADRGTVQTLLTGNTAANAAAKLGAFGLAEQLNLDLGAYGSDAADRNLLVDVALARIEARHGPVARRRVWVIGDTPLDADCAHAGGVRCLLVATGFAPRDALETADADHVVDDLTDTAAILSLLA
jgi:phosphoglycolate phosphatase-like HAD superfamily hydrolase